MATAASTAHLALMAAVSTSKIFLVVADVEEGSSRALSSSKVSLAISRGMHSNAASAPSRPHLPQTDDLRSKGSFNINADANLSTSTVRRKRVTDTITKLLEHASRLFHNPSSLHVTTSLPPPLIHTEFALVGYATTVTRAALLLSF